MDLGIVGIVDIVIIVIALLSIIIGYKKGFMNKALSMFGILVIFVFAIMYQGALTQVFKSNNIIYNDIYDTFKEKIDAFTLTVAEGDTYKFVDILKSGFGIVAFLAYPISWIMGSPSTGLTNAEYADIMTNRTVNIISFLIIFVAGLIIYFILKLISKNLRNDKFIRFIDGVLGIILYLVLSAIFVYVVFFVLNLIMDQSWFSSAKEWLTVDMQLDTDKFRISKAMYNNNLFVRIKELFF